MMRECDRQQRVHVVDMARKLRTGDIGRRGFIRAAARAGFGFACARYLAGSRLCAAEQGVADAPLAASGLTDDQRHFLQDVGRSFKGTRIRVVSENTPPGVIIGRMIREEFTPLTGIEVEWQPVPLDQVLAKTVQDTLKNGNGHPRVVAKSGAMPGTTRHFAVTRRAIEGRMGTSPHLPAWVALANEVNAAELGRLTTGRQGVEETLRAIQDKTVAFLAKS